MSQYKISSTTMWFDIEKEFQTSGGIYILKCSNKDKSFEPIPINRLLKSDKEGILYIGNTSCFTDRVATLKKSLSPKHVSSSHKCGVKYKSNELFIKKLPFNCLYIELHHSNNPREMEKEFLEKYEKEFGELPPFNRSN